MMLRLFCHTGLTFVFGAFLLIFTFTAVSRAQDGWAPGEQELQQTALKLMREGRVADAVPLAERRLLLVQKTFGENSRKAVIATESLATYCLQAGDYPKARKYYAQNIALARKVFGPGDGWVFTSLGGLGRMEAYDGNYEAAVGLLKRAVKGAEEAMGKDDSLTATMVGDLADALTRKQDYKAALPLFERVLQQRAALSGPESAGVASALQQLSVAQRGLGRLNEAELSLTKSLAIYEKTSGAEHPNTAMALYSLGLLYNDLNDQERAAGLLERSLAIREKVHGPDHFGTLADVQALALVRTQQIRYDLAEPLYRRALRIAEKKHGPDHTVTAKMHGGLGSVLSNLDQHEEAVKHLLSAATVLEAKLGPESPELADELNSLGQSLEEAGKSAEAEPFLRRALAIEEKAHGAESKLATVTADNLLWCLHHQGKTTEARKLAERGMASGCRRWTDLLSFGSEQQLESAFLLVNSIGMGESLGDAELAATSALRFKDALTSGLLERQLVIQAAAKDSPTRKLAAAAEASGKRLRELVLQAAPVKELAAARKQAEGDEKALTRKVSQLGQARSAMTVTPAQVAAALPPGAVLVEFTAHALYGLPDGADPKAQNVCFAIVIAAGRPPQMIRLGEQRKLESEVDALVKFIQTPPADLSGKALDAAVERAAKELHEEFITPWESALPPGTKTLVICPDAYLHYLPFAVLMNAEGRFLTERYELRHVSSGRDLLTAPRTPAKMKTAVLLGSPDYEKAVPKGATTEDKRLAEVARGMSFPPLPGTAVEIAALEAQFKASQWKVSLLSDAAATETAVTAVQTPTVLHLATHGFFTSPVGRNAFMSGAGASDLSHSMANSGLALAGAGSTVVQWAASRVPAAAEDGIFTAAEACSLNLAGTELVALSACETGLGLTLSGYGVAGLKRALTLAGARHLLTTLWQVNDDETAAFMQGFYTRFLAGEEPGLAMIHTQVAELQRLREKHGTWFAMNGAGPFCLTATSRWPQKAMAK